MSRNENLPGVPLGQLLGQANLLLTCLHCMWRETYDMQKVINQLLARGVNGPLIGICAARAHVRLACPRCGQQRWETRPDYIHVGPTGIPETRRTAV